MSRAAGSSRSLWEKKRKKKTRIPLSLFTSAIALSHCLRKRKKGVIFDKPGPIYVSRERKEKNTEGGKKKRKASEIRKRFGLHF